MAKSQLDDGQIDGQMSIEDLFEPPARLFAVSRIFARARKDMTLAEQKTFVYALSEFRFTENAKSNYVRLDKKMLANILGIHSDADHLSVDLFDNIKDMAAHSHIEIRERDLDFYASGFLITSVVSFKNIVRIRFNEDYLPLFTGLSKDYITMWSSDIFRMSTKRSVQFYEFLRQETDTREQVNTIGLGIKALKELFGIPASGPGSYMRAPEKGGFNRPEFEKKVILPLCEDLQKTRMIRLILQPEGMPYRKIKRGNRVLGYEFMWSFTSHPAVADAETVRQLQERVDKNPELLKIANDLANGADRISSKKRSRSSADTFNNFAHSGNDWDELALQIMEAQESGVGEEKTR